MDNTRTNLNYFILSALFAALTAVCSWISVPLPFTPVPINLATLAVFMAGGILGPKYGLMAECVYVLCGFFGLPVFAGFRGGPSVLIGPTGGFIAGYLICALAAGILVEKIYKSGLNGTRRVILVILSLITGLFCCYALGMMWFMHLTGSGLLEGLMACVVPFLIGDSLKIALATVLIDRLRRMQVLR